jgi:hypothetical protein
MVIDIGIGVAASLLIFLGFRILRVAYLIFAGDLNVYQRNRGRVRSFKAVYRGKVPTKYDGTRDDLVAAGVAIDTSTNTWVEQGRLSDEALQDALAN